MFDKLIEKVKTEPKTIVFTEGHDARIQEAAARLLAEGLMNVVRVGKEDEVKNLASAGQKRIVLDGVYSWTEMMTLKHEFPGQMTFIAVVVPKKLRYKRVAVRPERPFSEEEIKERDRSEIENLEKGGPIAAADYYVLNDGSVEQMEKKLGEILEEIKF